jgi:sulfonate transport system substrate-binding protein
MTARTEGFMRRVRFWLVVIVVCVGAAAGFAQAKPGIIHMDYATYNPVSLVLKDKGWLEQDLARDGVKVDWTLSQGSNRALEFLNANAVDFGSTAGAAAVIARSNGNPLLGVYLYSKPEWTALVTMPGSGITKIQDLKGRRVAATIGTDPYIFLLRALDSVGMTGRDIQLVSLQHADGGAALVRKDVDAWAGLDPIMARVQLENKAILFYRNPDSNTYGALNVRADFASKYPAYVVRVLAQYERAKVYARAHLPELVSILAREGQINPDVATLQINERTDLKQSVPNDAFRSSISAAAAVLQKGGQIKQGVDLKALVAGYVDPSFAEKALAQK